MKPLTLQLVKEKKSFLNHFTLPKIGGFTFLVLAIPTFFILPFLKGKENQWFFVYLYSILSLSLISWILMNIRFYFKYDYTVIGNLILSENHIEIDINNEKKLFSCSETPMVLHYNSIRGQKFHFISRDYARSGISEFELNNQHFKVLISTEKQLEDLKKTLTYWYRNNYSISEFMRTVEQNRLKELELIK